MTFLVRLTGRVEGELAFNTRRSMFDSFVARGWLHQNDIRNVRPRKWLQTGRHVRHCVGRFGLFGYGWFHPIVLVFSTIKQIK